MRRAALVALVAGCARVVARKEAARVEVTSSLSSPETELARPVALTLRCVHESAVEIEMPELGVSLGGLEVREKGAVEEREREEGRLEHLLRAELVSFVHGPFAIPSLAVRWKGPSGAEGTERTPELFLRVLSPIEGKAALDDLKDAYPPVPLPWKAPSAAAVFLWIAALGGLAAGGVFALKAYLRWRRWKAALGEAVLPHERALRGLEALAGMLDGDGFEEYFVGLSDVVRFYIEGNFGIRAPEQTTEEFLEGTASDGRLSSGHRALLRRFLEKCDLVKFARYEPAVREAADALEAARTFVRETRPRAERAREMRAAIARHALEGKA